MYRGQKHNIFTHMKMLRVRVLGICCTDMFHRVNRYFITVQQRFGCDFVPARCPKKLSFLKFKGHDAGIK